MQRPTLVQRLSHLLRRRTERGRGGTLRSLGWAVGLALLLRAFVAEAYVIPSGSMSPALEVGDRLFVAKAVYGLRIPFTTYKPLRGREPLRGEVAVFVHPHGGDTPLIKRVVALGGDTVALRDDQLVINGQAVPRRALAGPCERVFDTEPERCTLFEETLGGRSYRVLQRVGVTPSRFGPFRVPRGHVFVLGDSRDNSNDSRFWGTVPYSHLIGRAVLLWWSGGRPALRHGI